MTTHTLAKRHRNHIAKIDDGTYFHNALKKYGVDSFALEVIDTAKNLNELKEKEKYWILKFNSYVFNENSNGYNLTVGGDGVNGFVPSEKTRRKLSEAHKGKKHSDETIKKMKFAQRGTKHWTHGREFKALSPRAKEAHQKLTESLKGRKLSEEWKRKISESKKGKKLSEQAIEKISGANNYNAKKVLCLNTNEVFSYMGEVAKKYDIKPKDVSACCTGRQKSAGKHPVTGERMRWAYID